MVLDPAVKRVLNFQPKTTPISLNKQQNTAWNNKEFECDFVSTYLDITCMYINMQAFILYIFYTFFCNVPKSGGISVMNSYVTNKLFVEMQ